MNIKISMKNNSDCPDAVAVPQRRRFLTVTLMLGLALVITALPEAAYSAPSAPGFRADRILIKPKEGVSLSVLTNLNNRLGSHILKRFARMGNLHVISLPKIVSPSIAI